MNKNQLPTYQDLRLSWQTKKARRNVKSSCFLQYEINETDKEIDEMVYKLYELTEDEIEMIEKNIG